MWIIAGSRTKKKINAREVARSIVGYDRKDEFRDEEMIAESRRRASEARRKQKETAHG